MVSHKPHFPDTKGLETAQESVTDTRSGYSDIRIDYEEIIGEGKSVAYRYTWRAKRTGQSLALPSPPTGEEVILKGCVVVHVANGKVAEDFEHSDHLGFLQQLDVVPLPG